jgi:hypothetical protein
MKNKYSNNLVNFIFLTVFLLGGNILYGQKYTVLPDRLNIRNSPTDTSEVIGKLSKGDTITVINTDGDWYKVSINGTEGFVHKNFIEKYNESDKSDKSQTESKTGFKYGFSKGVSKSWMWVLIIMASIFGAGTQIKDGRFKKGFRERPFTGREIFNTLLYSGILIGLIGLITGIVFWVKSF